MANHVLQNKEYLLLLLNPASSQQQQIALLNTATRAQRLALAEVFKNLASLKDIPGKTKKLLATKKKIVKKLQAKRITALDIAKHRRYILQVLLSVRNQLQELFK